MKIPKKIKIGGHTYGIKQVANSPFFENDTCAKINRETGEILISKTLIQTEKELSLFHEIFHLINGELSEELVESLAQQVYQVCKDNKFIT